MPLTYTFPDASVVTPPGKVDAECPWESVPPNRLEKLSDAPSGASEVTNPSWLTEDAVPALIGFFSGKSVDCVDPTTIALPLLSTVILKAGRSCCPLKRWNIPGPFQRR